MILFMYLGLAVAGAGIVGGTIFLSKLIELEYDRFHNSWLADGRPTGGKRSRQDASFWLGGFSRVSVGYAWLFATPGWAVESVEAKSLLKWYRLWSGVFGVALGTLLTIAFVGG